MLKSDVIFTDANIPIAQLAEGDNARYTLDVDKALINSIKSVGIINPLTVKQNGKGYIVVAGHRRLSAAKKAALKEVPCRIIPEGEAPLIALIENSARKNLTDLEYAEAFSKCPEGSDSQIARLFGTTVTFVKQRRALSTLLPGIKKKIEKHALHFEAAEMLTKLSHDQQRELLTSDEINWDYASNIFHHVNQATRLTTDNALFDLNDYEGTLTADLWSGGIQVFSNQDEASALQQAAIAQWVVKLSEHPSWHFCHIIEDPTKIWGGDYNVKANKSSRDPSTIYNLPKTKAGRQMFKESPKTKYGVLVVFEPDRPDEVKWYPFASLRNQPNGSIPESTNDLVKEFKWGPTGKMVFDAHRTDLVREHMLLDKTDNVFYASLICNLSSIHMGREPLAWEKVEDRAELDMERPEKMGYSHFSKLVRMPLKQLKKIAKEQVVNAIFEQHEAHFGALDILAKHYKTKLAVNLFPTEQIFRLMPVKEIEDFRKKHGMEKTSFKTKKEIVKATAESCKTLGITWCPKEQDFTTKAGTLADDLQDHIPA